MEQIPYIAHEADMTRMERMNRRLWILNIILILILLATNAGWLYYANSFEEVTSTSVEQDVDTGNGDATVIGVGNYGTDKTDSDGN